MDYKIENKYIAVVVSDKGAELQRIYSKDTNLEYMWNGDPTFWGKKSPVLFPRKNPPMFCFSGGQFYLLRL